jgi:hypothetical protein
MGNPLTGSYTDPEGLLNDLKYILGNTVSFENDETNIESTDPYSSTGIRSVNSGAWEWNSRFSDIN